MRVLTSFGLREKSRVDKRSQIPLSSLCLSGSRRVLGTRGLSCRRCLLNFGASLQYSFGKSQYRVFDSSFKESFFPQFIWPKCSPFPTLLLLRCAWFSFLLLCWNQLCFTEASNREDLSLQILTLCESLFSLMALLKSSGLFT